MLQRSPLFRRILLALVVLGAVSGTMIAKPAHAIPGIGQFYAGLGPRTYNGFPGQPTAYFAGTVELGLDDVLAHFGIGARADIFTSLDTAYSVELRYSIFSVPFFRFLAGISGGVKSGVGLTGTYAAFLGVRASLGLPYVGLNLGFQGNGTEEHNGFGALMFGVCL